MLKRLYEVLCVAVTWVNTNVGKKEKIVHVFTVAKRRGHIVPHHSGATQRSTRVSQETEGASGKSWAKAFLAVFVERSG